MYMHSFGVVLLSLFMFACVFCIVFFVFLFVCNLKSRYFSFWYNKRTYLLTKCRTRLGRLLLAVTATTSHVVDVHVTTPTGRHRLVVLARRRTRRSAVLQGAVTSPSFLKCTHARWRNLLSCVHTRSGTLRCVAASCGRLRRFRHIPHDVTSHRTATRPVWTHL